MRKLGILLLLVLFLSACSNTRKNETEDKPTVTVSILPQKYFVERILGDHFKVNVMIPPGASPVSYEPTPLQMKELSNSETYIRIGHVEFEKAWMKKIRNINPDMKIIDQSVDANLIHADHKHEVEHDHSGHHHHHHHGTDPHIWISPKEVTKQIELIFQYFIKEYPSLGPDLEKNYSVFQSEIDSLDLYIQNKLESLQGKKFLIFHPALSYLARDYGLGQISIEIDGKEPTPANIREIVDIAKKDNIRVVFVQQQFSTHNAEVIAKEIDGKVVQIDPLSYQWTESIKMIVDEIVKSYSN